MRGKKRWILPLALLLIGVQVLTGCSLIQLRPQGSDGKYNETTSISKDDHETTMETSPVTTEACEETTPDALETLLSEMSIREKVGQLFIIRPDALEATLSLEQVCDAKAAGVTELSDTMRSALREYPVGGVILFSKNITDPTQLTGLTEAFQEASAITPLIAIDEEGGLVARLANHRAFDLPQYSSASAVGANGNADDARAMGDTIGAYLAQYGIHMDFAPVADVNTNPDNPVIGTRAFSADAKTVAQMARAMADGLSGQGIVPVFKHFPGHGDTAEDSHSGIAVSQKTKEEMAACEWLPYQTLGASDAVMVGHIATPAITGDLTPATMSKTIVTDILRGELGFQGVIITDSLAMGAITESYDSGEAAVGAFLAGCDMLLCPYNLTEAFDAVMEAVEAGTISEERLNESVMRILRLKQSYGILNNIS